jgi:hypothetical protein
MFVGHLAAALAGTKVEPRVPLGASVAAAFGIDLLWPVLLLAGAETVRIDQGNTAFTHLAFDAYPWSHSLVAVLVWSSLVFVLGRWRLGSTRAGGLLGGLVLSHWLLDFVVHRPDLPLWPAGPKVVLGLWNSIPGTFLFEGLFLAAGLVLYLRSRPAESTGGRVALASLVGLCVLIWASQPWAAPPPSETAVALVGIALWLLPPWAQWADRGRRASRLPLSAGLLVAVAFAASCAPDEVVLDPGSRPVPPPFDGTIFIDPDIITESDPTSFESLAYVGVGTRTMYDRRVNGWVSRDAFLFDATFDDGLLIEVQVNPEFGTPEAAEAQARRFAPPIGRLPTALRLDVETVWIHLGTEPFGGGNNNILIHTGQATLYERDGILEETLVHEAAHTSLDPYHASAAGWLQAQSADPTFISTYARDYPDREDIAETMVPYLAVRYRPDRVAPSMVTTILQAIPNRIAYLDGLGLAMYPISGGS